MSARPIIAATGLTRRFGQFTAVDGLSFAVAPGSIFAFLGANGSGKSTTIRMLIGLLTPTAGAVEVAGIDVVRTPRRVRDLIGYMGQRVSLYQGLTLRENLEFYAGLYDLTGAELEHRWGALRERFSLGTAEHERAGDLPAGVRQRAGLALSTIHRPRVLFLDEPTAGVDVQNRLLFWELIQDEAAAGVTVFVTTHFLEEVEYCDWVCFIDAGRLIANAEPDTIRERYSSGYHVRLTLPEARREEARVTLAAAGARVTRGEAGLEIQAPALTAAVFAAIERVAGRGADGSVHVEQPEMTEVFRELMLESAPAGAAVVPAAATPASRDDARPARADARSVAADDARPGARATSSERAARGPAVAAPALRSPASARAGYAARWRRLRTLMRREVRATLRDAFTVTILIAVPIGSLLAFGYTLSTRVHHLALGVHDASDTGASRRLIADLAANDTFDPRRFTTRADLDRALVAGQISAAIVIPPDFDRALGKSGEGRAPEIQVLYDGAETVVAGNSEAFLQAIARATGADLADRGAPPREHARSAPPARDAATTAGAPAARAARADGPTAAAARRAADARSERPADARRPRGSATAPRPDDAAKSVPETAPAPPREASASSTRDGGAPIGAPIDGGVRVVTRALFNPTLNGVPFMVAGTYGFVLTFLTTLITAVSIVNERLSGTFDQLQVTPATAGEIVLGKILPLGAVFALDVVLMIVVGGVVLGAWPAGNVLFFVTVACFYVLISLALGLIFSATSATAAEAVQKTVLFSIPLNFLGGFAFPIRNMPLVCRALSELLPATHFIAISRAIYLRGAGPLTLLPELALLGVFGVLLMMIAFRTVAIRA